MNWISFLLALASFIVVIVLAATNKVDLLVALVLILLSLALLVAQWVVVYGVPRR